MKKMGRILGMLLAAISIPTAHSQTHGDALQEGAPVKFASRQAGAAELFINAMLYRPAGSARGAMVIVNGPGGWADFREGQYARALSSAGYAALVIDSYGSRGIGDTYTDNTKLSPFAQARDALAARKYLVSIGYQSDRMAVMGSGRAGTIVLLASDRTFLQDESERFAAAVAISPACVLHPKAPKPASRAFIAIGDKNEGVQPCRDLAKEYTAAGGRVDLKVYPGTADGFDGSPNNVRMSRDPFIENFAACNSSVDSDGRAAYNGKTFGEDEASGLILEMRKSCVTRGGFTWTNLTQKAAVTFDLIEFLDSNFRR